MFIAPRPAGGRRIAAVLRSISGPRSGAITADDERVSICRSWLPLVDPSGKRNEVFAGGYTTYKDFPTITWTASQLTKGIFYIGLEMKDTFLSALT